VGTRFLLVCGLSLLVARAAFGADAYHLTRDKGTLVSINNLKLGDDATWSGKRDADGCAKGSATVTGINQTWSSSPGRISR
jgi:hypothetical protein